MSKFTVILETSDDELYRTEMDISGKTVSSILDDMIEMWHSNVKASEEYSLQISHRKEGNAKIISIVQGGEDVYKINMDTTDMTIDEIFEEVITAWKEEIATKGLRIQLTYSL